MDEDLATARTSWDAAAATFDAEPDHGLTAPLVRAAWSRLLARNLGPASRRVADLCCGTGSLSAVLVALGHEVTGLDLSPAMLARAWAKLGPGAALVEGDVARPDLPAGGFGAVLARHVLWALPDPAAVLARWARLLAPGGILLVIDAVWHTGAGIAPVAVLVALPPT